MNFYFAPMEGIGGYIYRNAHKAYFQGIDKYFMPFVAPTQNNKFTTREKMDILPDHNKTLVAVPQILANRADHFIFTAKALEAYGYKTVNLNLGCPSSTVVSKKKGSGFLGDLDKLHYFLDEIYQKCPLKISIKTRLGLTHSHEFVDLMKMFNKFPLEELIIHPRTQKDYYKNTPDQVAFQEALVHKTMPVVYNGDIFTQEDYRAFTRACPQIDTLMLGRGILGNPNLVAEIKGGQTMTTLDLKAFHDKVLSDYIGVMSGEKPVLYKMKELWFYMIHLFEGAEKHLKKIRKSQNLRTYTSIVESMFEGHALVDNGLNFHNALKGIKK